MTPTLALVLALQSTTVPGVFAPPPIAVPGRTETGGPPLSRSAEFDACVKRAGDDPAVGVASALDWVGRGGGWLARECLGFGYAQQGDFAAAAAGFARAASEAEVAQPSEAARLWVQAGNAAIASGDAAAATRHFDAALARGSLTGLPLGEAHLDRARARAATGDVAGAASDLERARADAAADPLTWLLSATLARRQGDLANADVYIAEAATRAPTDPAVILEAGNIAILSGQEDAARKNWQAVVAAAPDGPEAVAARDNLSRLPADTNSPALPIPPVETPTQSR